MTLLVLRVVLLLLFPQTNLATISTISWTTPQQRPIRSSLRPESFYHKWFPRSLRYSTPSHTSVKYELPPKSLRMTDDPTERGYKSLIQFLEYNGNDEDRMLIEKVRLAVVRQICNRTYMPMEQILRARENKLLSTINVKRIGYRPDKLEPYLFNFDVEKERQKVAEMLGVDEIAAYLEKHPEDRSRPCPVHTPKTVIQLLIQALSRVDGPDYNAGIRTLRNFVHPSSTLKRFETEDELRLKIDQTNYRCVLNNKGFQWYREPYYERGGEGVRIKTKISSAFSNEWVEVEWILAKFKGVWHLKQFRTQIW